MFSPLLLSLEIRDKQKQNPAIGKPLVERFKGRRPLQPHPKHLSCWTYKDDGKAEKSLTGNENIFRFIFGASYTRHNASCMGAVFMYTA